MKELLLIKGYFLENFKNVKNVKNFNPPTPFV